MSARKITPLLVTSVLVLAILVTGCGTPGAAPTVAAVATQVAPTAAAIATQVAPTIAAAQPTAVAAATQVAPTIQAAEATLAPTVEAAATSLVAAGSGLLKIAIMGPFTGSAASIGLEQLHFAQLAVDDFNKSSGLNVQLVQGDTELDASKAVNVAQRLVSDPTILAIVGPAGSQEVEAVSPILSPANLVFVSPSATRPSLTESGVKNFFRVVPRDDVQGPTDAKFMIDKLSAKSVYLVDDQTSYSTGLADQCEMALKAGGVTTTRESVTQKDTDFSALVTKIKGANPDVVFFPGQLASQAALLAKQMQEQGVKAILFGGDGIFDPQKFIKEAGGATEGDYVSFFAPDIHGIAADQSIVATYEKQYGSFGSFGAPSYAATMVVLHALQRALQGGVPTRQSVLAEVAKTNESTSILGIPIQFDSKGDIQGAKFFIFQVKNGQFVLAQ